MSSKNMPFSIHWSNSSVIANKPNRNKIKKTFKIYSFRKKIEVVCLLTSNFLTYVYSISDGWVGGFEIGLLRQEIEKWVECELNKVFLHFPPIFDDFAKFHNVPSEPFRCTPL